jgi:hypothetical protein
MPISINGAGTITGVSAGGLPNNSIITADIANANVTPTKLSQPLTLMAAMPTTSGTFIDFTGIPSWVKRITIGLSQVGTSVNSSLLLRVGNSSGIKDTGYTSCSNATDQAGGTGSNTSANGFVLYHDAITTNRYCGIMTLMLVESSTLSWTWVSSHSMRMRDLITICGGGAVNLTFNPLDSIRLTTSGGNTFNNGIMNVMYEG